jgi:hypothetical protein
MAPSAATREALMRAFVLYSIALAATCFWVWLALEMVK